MNKHSFHFTFIALLLMAVTGCSFLPQQDAQEPERSADEPKVEPAQPAALKQPAEKAALKQPPEKAAEDRYTVKKGDSLSAIAQRFSVTSLQLQYRNKISNPRNLQIGAKLVIPDPGLQVPPSFPSDRRRFIWPLKKLDVSSEFGERHRRHMGIDLRAPRGTPIHASADGVVHFVGKQSGYGKVVILQHDDKTKTLYGHNHRNLVRKGQKIRQGEVIATVGRTGNASGHHLHFEYIKADRKLNPRKYISPQSGS